MRATGGRVAALALLVVLVLPGWAKAQQPLAVRMGYSSPQQIPYSATLVAWEDLRGVKITPVFMRTSPLAVQTLLRGDVQMVQTNPPAAFKAIAEGAPLTVVSGLMLNDWTMVSRADLADAHQLAGKQVAVHSESSMSYSVTKYTIKKQNIPDVRILFIAGSLNRAQALRTGQIDGAALYMTDAVRLNLSDPGKFRILVDFASMTEAIDSVILVRKDWLGSHPKEMREIIKGMLEAYRWMPKRPAEAKARVTKLYPTESPALVSAALDTYLSRGMWPPDGGVTAESIRGMLDFFVTETGDLSKDAKRDPASYATLDPLEDVLREIGRTTGRR
jgi:ABC-type nitrate/sulfonate/bicarbonate transport system substrate-binding protein